VLIFPNPNDGKLNISFNMTQKDDVIISIFDLKGVLINKTILKNVNKGKNLYTKEINDLTNGSVYLISLETSFEKITQKLIIEK
jgi:hypothetical protein